MVLVGKGRRSSARVHIMNSGPVLGPIRLEILVVSSNHSDQIASSIS